MGTSWIKRHSHEEPERIKAEKRRYEAWKKEHKRRFPTHEDLMNHIRAKYNWPKYSKYQNRLGEEDEQQ